MKTKRVIAAASAAAMLASLLTPVSFAEGVEPIMIDFTSMTEAAAYTAEAGQGFVEYSSAIMPEGFARQVAPLSEISVSPDGAVVTENGGAYTHSKTNTADGDDYNYGGLIYRVDTGAPGAYHIEVTVTGSSADTRVAPTGMDASRLTGASNWDNCNQVPRTVSASWSGSTWSYDFATGESFIEIEIEPTALATAENTKTVGVKSISITPLEVNPAGDKPTIHILGDSTEKAYSFNETISSWGQTLRNYFDPEKVNVINYSMGGRAMKSNYNEGRFDELLIRGAEGDYVFIHSAHNDETISTNRFSRGAGTIKDNLAANNENYNKWLDMYVNAIKARGMIPVLVSAMPRINSATGAYSENDSKPNGFNPDSVGNMRAKAESDSEVGFVELYEGAKQYLSKLDGKEVGYIYNSIEAGETPANNSANGANGDGTHYREAAAKQFCRIMLKSIYDQANADTDTYTDKPIMQSLVELMPEAVKAAAESGDWSAVFPEVTNDVSAVDVVPGAEKQGVDNFYYRTSIEKALQLGLLHKDTENNFKPTQTITVGEYARGIEKAFGLEENALKNYTKTYAQLTGTEPEETTAPTNEPEETTAPTNEPEETAAPQTKAAAANGNTVVTLGESKTGEIIAAVYNNGRLAAVKSAAIAGAETTIEGIEADKVFIWDSLSGAKPLENAVAVEKENAQLSEASSGEGEITIAVAQTAGGTVTAYNDTQQAAYTVDVKSSYSANETVSDNDYFTLIAPPEIVSGSTADTFSDNEEVTGEYIEFRNANPVKTFTYKAKADGRITVYCSAGTNKPIELAINGATDQKWFIGDNAEAGTGTVGTVHFNVKADTEYTLYTRGGNGKLFGIKYEGADIPCSTSELKANAGDRIRVVAEPEPGYAATGILVDGTQAEFGSTYTFTAASNVTVSAAFEERATGNTTITVVQPEGGLVTIYNDSAFDTQTLDIPSGLTSGQVFDNKYFTFTVPTNVANNKSDSGGVFAGNSEITTTYTEFRNADGLTAAYKAKADGILAVYARFQGSKAIELVGKTTQTKYVDSDTSIAGSTEWAYGAVHFNVEAGQTYTLQARGGTGRLFGIKYESTDYPQSTESLKVNDGDTIRVTAAADTNYVNDAIIVNGEKISSGKEATFTASGDTTVTAAFVSEPALVEDTVVPTDAALTREIMGAILYDAYQLADKTNIAKYMAQNGGVPSPDDPNYDPNIQYEGSPYIPTTGWGALTDKEGLDDDLYGKVKAAYNLGLIRPETGIARGSIALGSELEPNVEVTRAKAAKSLVFAFVLTQPQSDESQTVPAGFAVAEPGEIKAPNAEAPSGVFKN